MNTLYRKVPSLLVNKLAQVFTSRDFIFVTSMKSEAYVGIGIMGICDENGIPSQPRYDNVK